MHGLPVSTGGAARGPHGPEDTAGRLRVGALASLAGPARRVHMQWVPSHCGVDGNERADAVAKEAAAFEQASGTLDVRTAHRAAARAARQRAIESWPDGWYRTLMGDQMPPPVTAGDRSSAVDVQGCSQKN